MSDPRAFREVTRLRDGTPVTIRAVRADDRERVARAFAALDRDTVYTRFFAYRKALDEAELARLAAMDFVGEAMLVATVGTGDDETIVAGARYVVDPAGDARTAEIAFTVEEDFQGRGLAGRMLDRLAALARTNGIARFEAIVLDTNRPMLRVFERSGLPATTSRRDGDVVVTLDLGAAGGRDGGPAREP